MPLVNPSVTGERDELDRCTEPGQPQNDEDDAGHHRRNRQPLDAVFLHNAVDDHDEGAGRPADLHARTAQRGNQESRDDRGQQPALGRESTGNGKGDGERQRDNADNHARRDVRNGLPPRVSLERGDEFGNEHGSLYGGSASRVARPAPASRSSVDSSIS